MANKSKKSNKKNLIIVGICAAVAVVIIVVVAIILANHRGLNDGFFSSDGTKYVLNLGSGDVSFEESEYDPVKTHLVYFYSGDEITDLKAYYEYTDNSAAQAAAEYLKENYDEAEADKIAVEGKFVIFTAPESEYQDLTASAVKEQIEFMEAIRNMNIEASTKENTDTTETETEESESTEEEQLIKKYGI